MSPTFYESGRDFEYRVMAYLRKRGYLYVTRSAGSHGIIDIHAAKRLESSSIKLAVQAKHGKSPFGPEDADLLIEWARAFEAIPILASNDKDGHIVTSRVTKTGLSAIAV
jgi:Holliday junction resolvase